MTPFDVARGIVRDREGQDRPGLVAAAIEPCPPGRAQRQATEKRRYYLIMSGVCVY